MKLWIRVAAYHLLLCAIIGGIIALTLYAGRRHPHAVQLPEERQRVAASNGEAASAPGGTGEIESSQPALSPKTGGSEPWYG
mgnify:FL=1|jgi:hypothetical protein|nr:MAG TPA_asm: hypothetical protein [Caudoviricetes sp.]